MTVQELIEKLQTMPQDLQVYTKNDCADDGVSFFDVDPEVKTLFLNKYNEPSCSPSRVGSPQIITIVKL